MRLNVLKIILPNLAIAVILAGCMTSQPASVAGVKMVVGGSLPGSQGKTLSDQSRIDETVARGCGGGIFSASACKRHTEASAERLAELRGAL